MLTVFRKFKPLGVFFDIRLNRLPIVRQLAFVDEFFQGNSILLSLLLSDFLAQACAKRIDLFECDVVFEK